ncbi:MAG: thioredoxin domain-containing protein [Chloroflexi bacterium]|nr:thioredoxin domain-containing protein [Chloroflexota bacterium]MYJ57532.1 thioredoxin domain-containing protein [Chloroflexota bacterium]
MIDELVRTGLARFEYRHILNHGPPSVAAALATECGGDQGRWWDFHDHYMTTQDFSRDGAVALAASLSLDTEQFAQCLDNQVHLELVEEQHRAASQAGFNRTPTIRINGEGGAVNDALIEQVQDLAAQLGSEEG